MLVLMRMLMLICCVAQWNPAEPALLASGGFDRQVLHAITRHHTPSHAIARPSL
jgi:hypothetical protein